MRLNNLAQKQNLNGLRVIRLFFAVIHNLFELVHLK